MGTLVGRMFWTDKGPKYLVMLIIMSLVIYMFSTLLGSTKIEQDLNDASNKVSSWYLPIKHLFERQSKLYLFLSINDLYNFLK